MRKAWFPAIAILAALSVFWLRAPEPPRDWPASGGGERARPEPPAAAREPRLPLRTEEPPAVQPFAVLEGQVIDDQELPVARASVSVDSTPPQTVLTGKDGTFSFSGLPLRPYRLAARRGARLAGPVTAWLTDRSEPVVLRLRPGATLQVQVVDRRALTPVRGARIEMLGPAGLSQATDEKGEATLSGLDSVRQTLRVSAAGFATAFRTVNVPAAGETVRELVALDSGASAEGTVIDVRRQPIAGARVTAESIGIRLAGAAAWTLETRSDDAGHWAFADLQPGRYRFTAADASHAPGEATAPVGEGAGHSIAIVLEDGGRVAGRVAGSGGAAAGAVVRVAAGEWEAAEREVRADQEGRFDIAGLPRRSLRLMALSASAVSAVYTADLRSEAHVTGLTLELNLAGAIEGAVETPRGEPVAEALVTAVREPGQGDRAPIRLRGAISAVADAAGRFKLEGLEEGRYRLRAGFPGSASGARQAGILAAAGDRDVRLIADRPGRVQGKVAFADGRTPSLFSVGLALSPAAQFAGTSGQFVLDGVPSGSNTLVVSSSEFTTKIVQVVASAADQPSDVGTVFVEAGRTVSGFVTDASGRPVPGATVAGGAQLLADGVQLGTQDALDDLAGMVRTTSGADGRYLLAGIPTGAFSISAESGAGRSRFVAVPSGDESREIDLTIDALGTLTGRVTRGGEAAAGAVVSATPQGLAGSQLIARCGADGTYRLEKVPPGAYLVTATIGAGQSATAKTISATVRADEAAPADIEIDSGEITVRVRPPRGGVNAQVFLLDAAIGGEVKTSGDLQSALADHGQGGARSALIAAGSEALFVDVSPGQYSLCSALLPPGDLTDAAVLDSLRRNRSKLPVACAQVQVPAGQQEISLQVPLGA